MTKDCYRLKQDGMIVARAEGPDALREIMHYAFVHSLGGPVSIEERRNRRWRKWSPPGGPHE